jgi:Tfp pilus assembly protein PilO
MAQRERLIACLVVALIAVGAMWLILVSPERKSVVNLESQISAEHQTLSSDQAQLVSAEQARTKYPAELHAMNVLLTAVPLTDEEPQLIKLINGLENGHTIKWSSATFAPSSSGSFPSLDLTFSFTANYLNLQSFLTALDSLARTDGLNVATSGRLATVNSISLSGVGKNMTAGVTITVYQEPLGTAAIGASSPSTTTTASP